MITSTSMNFDNKSTSKIGFGGGCHWCTEAVFQIIRGVKKVEQGWIASEVPNDTFSEAIVVHFDDASIDLAILIDIHLHTHSCTSLHSMRTKYRSAIYTFEDYQIDLSQKAIVASQDDFEKSIITKVLPFKAFRENKEEYQNYFSQNPDRPFCKTYIHPKLSFIKKNYANEIQNPLEK